MNVLFLPKYGPQAASARYRFLQYIPFLQARGVRCEVSPLFDDIYLARRFATGRPPPLQVAEALVRRVRAVISARARSYDLLVLHYEALPYAPPLLERLLRQQGTPYLYDYDDAIFHNYDQSRLLRPFLKDKIREVIAGAAAVLAGSEYLADYARAVNRRVELLPTVIDLARYPMKDIAGDRDGAGAEDRPFTVGWIGSPSTAAYLPAVAPALRALAQEGPLRLLLIGSGEVALPGLPCPGVTVEVRPWQEAREVEDLLELDVGIMPLPDTPWARGKCGFKLIQYMACGLPVVASPVGANRDIVRHGESGLLAQTETEWLAALRRLRADRALRAALGGAGRAEVAARYCLAVTAPRLLDVMQAAAGAAADRRAPGAASR